MPGSRRCDGEDCPACGGVGDVDADVCEGCGSTFVDTRYGVAEPVPGGEAVIARLGRVALAGAFAAALCGPAGADDCAEYGALLDKMSATVGSSAFNEVGRKVLAVRQVVLETRAPWLLAVRAWEASVASMEATGDLVADIAALEGPSDRRRLLLLRRGLKAHQAAMLAEDEAFYVMHCVAPPTSPERR